MIRSNTEFHPKHKTPPNSIHGIYTEKNEKNDIYQKTEQLSEMGSTEPIDYTIIAQKVYFCYELLYAVIWGYNEIALISVINDYYVWGRILYLNKLWAILCKFRNCIYFSQFWSVFPK